MRVPLSVSILCPEPFGSDRTTNSMSTKFYDERQSDDAAEHYESDFVPMIGGPVASDLVEGAALRKGERVLDVACGTGVVARLAAQRVGERGRVAGLDINPAMLAVARRVTPPELAIAWYETSAEAMPLPDAGFDAVLCSMGLQFMENAADALREMLRVLAPGGRLALCVPGPTPKVFATMADIAEHLDAALGPFMHAVFSLHDPSAMAERLERAGFRHVVVRTQTKTLRVPPPTEFFWRYLRCTPLAGALARLSEQRRAALEREVVARWREFETEGGMTFGIGMTTATASADR